MSSQYGNSHQFLTEWYLIASNHVKTNFAHVLRNGVFVVEDCMIYV